MTPLELITALRLASEKATPGPWTHGFEDSSGECSDSEGGCIVGDTVVVRGGDFDGCPVGVQSEENAAYIALANPTNIKVLLDTLERAVETLDKIEEHGASLQPNSNWMYLQDINFMTDTARDFLESIQWKQKCPE